MSRPQRVFSATQLPPEIPDPVRQVLQGFAQSIDQLVTAADQITPAASISVVTNGAKAGSFNAQFLVGTIAAANTKTTFNHKLGRQPVGAIEFMCVPQANQAKVPATQVASAIAILTVSNSQISLTSTAANRQFTLILF